jgi:hypothetical protein
MLVTGRLDFHQILISDPNFPMKILKFQIQISIMYSTTHGVSQIFNFRQISTKYAPKSQKRIYFMNSTSSDEFHYFAKFAH